MPDQGTHTVLAVAAQRAGICRRAELLEAGMSPSAIDRKVRSGLLVNVSSGVYLVTTLATADTPLFRALKGVPGSVISRRSAAIVHAFELPPPSDGLVHVTANAGRGQHLPGVNVHETRWLPKADIQLVEPGLVVTSPARTIIDLAAELRAARLRHLIQR